MAAVSVKRFITFRHSNENRSIKHEQTPSNSTKQGVQTVKCLVTKQCLMVLGRQTFPVFPGPYAQN